MAISVYGVICHCVKIISLGEILWDVLPDAEHLGGAPFNFAFHAHTLGHQVCFVSAVGADSRGDLALQQITEANLSTKFIRPVANHPTGTVTVTLDASGGPQYQINRPAAYDFPALDSSQLHDLLTPAPDWIYFGTLQQMSPQAHALTQQILSHASAARRLYDVNLRKDSYTSELVSNLANQANVLKLNEHELPELANIANIPGTSLEEFCRVCARTFALEAVCVTLGAKGCALLRNEEYVEAAGFRVEVADTIGAGDASSAALVHGLSSGWPARQTAEFANRVGALVAGKPGGTPKWMIEEAMRL
jgi:fructokinase